MLSNVANCRITTFHFTLVRNIVQAFGDITGVIRDLEGSIVRQLEQRVVEHESLLFCVGARLAELDVLASFAEAAKQSQYIRPIITPEPVLVVKAARHPLLQEVLPHTLVPNDISVSLCGYNCIARHTQQFGG
jgi:DNA mismatch repair ATPase MutS